MDMLLIAVAIGLVVGVPVAVVVLLLKVFGQERRLRALEARLNSKEWRATTADTPAQEHLSKPAPEAAARPRPAAADMPGPARSDGPESAPESDGPWQQGKAVPEPPASPGPTPAPTFEPAPQTPPRAIVLHAGKARELSLWLAANWIYLVAAVSLVLAGIFLLQYGIENGLLPPAARVIGALAFGAALVGAGEYLRRRWGDEAESATAFLPSVFSGAGIITLFAAILAALHLYALIGAFVALAGLVAVALLAIVLGWFSGPLLAGLGVAGAFISPFLVGGESDVPELFYAYFGLIALVGLAIDAVRRWAWVSLLTLVLAYGAATLLFVQTWPGQPEWFMALLVVLALAAIAIPVLSLAPAHSGAAIAESFVKGLPRGWPQFPTRLAGAAMLASSVLIALLSQEDEASFWLAATLLAGLFAAIVIWARKARALEDLAALPVLGLLALAVFPAYGSGDAISRFHEFLNAAPGTAMPLTPFILTAIAAGVSLLAAWRSLAGARWPLIWAAGAALAGPMMMLVLEIWWRPAAVTGAYPWALAAAAMAVMMGLLAGWFARADGADKRRAALVALAALAMISFGLIIVLSEAALTLALALTVLAAAALDRRFNMAALALFMQVGVVVIGWRLVIDPGLGWTYRAGLGDIIAVYAGTIAALVSAHVILGPRKRRAALIVLESAAWTLLAVFASVLITRLLETGPQFKTHWSIGLTAVVWLASAANQLWRLQAGGRVMKKLRVGLAGLFALIAAKSLFIVYGPANPLLSRYEEVLGPPLLNSLALAYLLPALVVAFVAWRFTFLPTRLRIGLGAIAAAGAAFWLALVIRHFWQGPVLSAPGTTQGELYSYTIAMLLTGAGLLYQAIAGGSTLLRRLAMSVIALTVAKVFLVDASGLTGLTRVFSFLALGLSLAGLAWLNRWAAARAGEGQA